ncbi:general stress protein [Cytobacillus solani]|uniref:general stress protein n=1 Tax=Cytobacillus solani TaxID=1637975 RepID=UPI00114F0010|nr:general stress protein [Cytobacillus solani]
MANVIIVENGVEAKEQIQQFIDQGFTKEDIYLLAHDNNRSNDLTNALNIKDIGVEEQGFFDSFANVFRTRGDELRSKLKSLGVSSLDAEQYEREMDQGKVVVLATRSA